MTAAARTAPRLMRSESYNRRHRTENDAVNFTTPSLFHNSSWCCTLVTFAMGCNSSSSEIKAKSAITDILERASPESAPGNHTLKEPVSVDPDTVIPCDIPLAGNILSDQNSRHIRLVNGTLCHQIFILVTQISGTYPNESYHH